MTTGSWGDICVSCSWSGSESESESGANWLRGLVSCGQIYSGSICRRRCQSWEVCAIYLGRGLYSPPTYIHRPYSISVHIEHCYFNSNRAMVIAKNFSVFWSYFFRLLFAVRKFVRMLNGCMFWQFMWRQIKTNTTNCPPLGLLFCLGLGTGTGVLYIISILMIFNHARLEAVQRRTPKANIFLANNKSQANFAWHLFWQFCIITSVSFWFNFFLNFIFRFSRISCGFLRCA